MCYLKAQLLKRQTQCATELSISVPFRNISEYWSALTGQMIVVNFRQVEETIMSTQNSWLLFTKVLIIRKCVIFQIIRDIWCLEMLKMLAPEKSGAMRMLKFLAPPLPFGQARSSTSWVLHLLNYFLPFSSRKLEISINIDAMILKFCMRHPWIQSLRFRKNQIFCMSLSLLVGLLPYWN